MAAVLTVVGCGGSSQDSNEGGEGGGTGPGGSSGAAGIGGTLAGGTGGTVAGGSSGTTSLGGSSGASTGGTGGSAAASACNDVQPSTDQVSLLLDPTTNPSPQGGAFTPGVYHLESITYHGVSDPSCLDDLETLDFTYSLLVAPDSTSDGTFQMVLVASDTEIRVTIDYTIDGITLLTNIVCGEGSTATTPYTADTTTLTLFTPADGICGSRADVLRLQ